MADVITVLGDLIDPQVMGDSISAELPAALRATGFIKVDTNLKAKAGSSITVPRFQYIGAAADLAEGTTGDIEGLSAVSMEYTVKKAVKNVELTDEAVLSGYGNPVGETTKQLRMALMDKIDNDAIALLIADGGVKRITDAGVLDYNAVSTAMAIFNNEEQGGETYLLVSQEGLTQLRAEALFLANDTIASDLLVKGMVGMIAGAKVIVTNKLYASNDTRQAYLLKPEALTAFMKSDVNFETARNVIAKKTLFSVDQHYTVAIEDASKVVGITHLNNVLGQMSIKYELNPQSDGTTDFKILSCYPPLAVGNELKARAHTAPVAVDYDDVLTTGWTDITIGTTELTDMSAAPVISFAICLTADDKAKYWGSMKVM